jgi:shikimate kinase/3-dehydroquinate synthase
MNPSSIFLYGPSGSGKSTVGKILADALQLPFFDLDAEIEARSTCTIEEIFARQGERGFRDFERRELEQLLSQRSALIALGGGALTVPAVRALVEAHGSVVCLRATSTVLLTRLQSDPTQRPLLVGDAAARLESLLTRRGEHYASFPLQLDTSQLDPAQVAWEVQILLGRFRVGKVDSPYEVWVQPDGLGTLGEALRQRDFQGPLVVVTDSNVGPLYAGRAVASLESAGFPTQVSNLPAGEKSKTIFTAQKLWEDFLDAGLERGSTVVALGGGVVGDLTGFAASAYLRGIRWVNVPTTLLAMVDSSLGGKTGVDIPRGKNLVGAFYPPAFVLADPQALTTLPEAEFRSGMAEAIKHGILGDQVLLDQCGEQLSTIRARGGEGLSEIVSRSMAVKIGVIEADPYEKGVRASLNLGHTVGHALELASGFRLRHGEAVAIGMVVEARLAERLCLAEAGLSERIAHILAGAGLPVEIPGDLDRTAIRSAIGVDKKKTQGRVRYALPVRIGQVQIGIVVPDDVLAAEI